MFVRTTIGALMLQFTFTSVRRQDNIFNFCLVQAFKNVLTGLPQDILALDKSQSLNINHPPPKHSEIIKL